MSSSTAQKVLQNMSSTYEDAIPPSQLCRNWGLDPLTFKADEARKEGKLQEVMLLPSWFFEVLGNVNDTDLAIVVGVRGAGKSALRRLIAEYCESSISTSKFLEGDVLCVTIDHDVPYWVRRAIAGGNPVKYFSYEIADLIAAGILSRTSVEEIRKRFNNEDMSLLNRFIQRLKKRNPNEAQKILDATRSRVDKTYKAIKDLEIFQDALSIATKQDVRSTIKDSEDMSSDETYIDSELKLLVHLAKKIGYKAVYVLVDEIDEYDEVGKDTQKAAELITPVLSSLRLLEINGLAFKFFISEPVYGKIKKLCEENSYEIRWDRTSHNAPFFLGWKNDDISEMLERRLRAYSLKTPITTLNIHSDGTPQIDIDAAIVRYAYRSPRFYIKFAHRIIINCARNANRDGYKISNRTFKEALREFCCRTSLKLYPEVYINSLLKLGLTNFREEIFIDKLGVTKERACEVLSDLEGCGALRKTQQLDGIDYEVIDTRLAFIIDSSIKNKWNICEP